MSHPFVPVDSGGAAEATPPEPFGEYAWSVLGRERAFEHAAQHTGTPVLLYRLNYAVELRYGVLTDLAQRLLAGRPVRRNVGHVNLVGSGDVEALREDLGNFSVSGLRTCGSW